MKNLFRSLWTSKKAFKPDPKERPIDFSWQDVPRYPPYAEGYPAVCTKEIVRSQDELIRKIARESSFNRNVFDTVLIPVIENYAGYAHLLPASQNNHHSGAGGLFRHGLEVGHIALRKAQAKRFNTGPTQEDRRNNEPVWHLAAFIAGLLHDIGKPVIDMAVHDKSGNQWSPTFEYIDQWAEEKVVDRYYIRWLDKRGKRHELMTSVNLAKLIGEKATRYIRDHDEEIFFAMCEAAIGRGLEGALAHIVMDADKASVSHDLKLNRSPAGYGVPVDRFIVDAMRRLVQNQKWVPNQAGSSLWVLDAGVFINWKSGIHDVLQLIEKDGTPGIPRDPDTLADILVELGIAIGRPLEGDSGEGKYYRYWKVLVPVENEQMTGQVAFQGLRIDSPEYLFTDDVPEAGEGHVDGLLVHDGAPQVENNPEGPAQSATAEDSALALQSTETVVDISHFVEVPPPMHTGATESAFAESEQSKVHTVGDKPAIPENPTEQPVQNTKIVTAESPEQEGQLQGIGAIQQLNNGLNDQLNALSPFGLADSASAPTKEAEQPIQNVQKDIQKVQPELSTSAVDHPLASKAVKASTALKNRPASKQAGDRPVLNVSNSEVGQKTAGVEPEKQPQNPRENLENACKCYGRSGEVLLKEVDYILNGGTLGEALCIGNGQVMLIHPEGVSRHGEVKKILPELSGSGMFDMGATGMRAIHEVNGMRGLLIIKSVTQLILQCFKEIEGTIERHEKPFDIPKPARKRQINKKARKAREQKDVAAKAVKSAKERSGSTDSSRNGVAILPKRNMAAHRKQHDGDNKMDEKLAIAGKTPPLTRKPTDEIKEHRAKAGGRVMQAKGPAALLIEEFIEQMRVGEGSLLYGQPEDKQGLRWIDEQSISLICSKSLDVAPVEVRLQLKKHPQTVLSDRQIGVRFQ